MSGYLAIDVSGNSGVERGGISTADPFIKSVIELSTRFPQKENERYPPHSVSTHQPLKRRAGGLKVCYHRCRKVKVLLDDISTDT